MLKAYENGIFYVKKHHSNKAMAIHAENLFNDNAVFYFRKILKLRQKQFL